MPERGASDEQLRAVVLVVDDDPTIRTFARHELGAAGFVVHEAASGEEALARLDAVRPDLIVLDVQMPGIDGFETCRRIRAGAGGEDVSILMATAAGDFDAVERSFEVGATDFITKPIPWELFRRRVRFLLRANHAFRELRTTLAALSASEHRLAAAQRIARLGHWESDAAGDSVVWSEEAYRIFGYEPFAIEPSWQTLFSLVVEDDRPRVEKAIADALASGGTFSLDHAIARPDGEIRIVHHQGEIVDDVTGGVRRVTGSIQDVTERKSIEARIEKLAYHDELTGLPNRRFFTERLDRLVAFAREHGKQVGVLFVDVDRFKRVNDSLGHRAGDELLRAASERLLECVRINDEVSRPRAGHPSLARFGGDEFVVALALDGPEGAMAVARRIVRAFARPFVVESREVTVSVSVGVAYYPQHGEDAHALLRSADVAMYQAKTRGRNTVQTYSAALNEHATNAMALESDLQRALTRREFMLYYQPKVDARTGSARSLEALLRWRHPERGMIPPLEFITIAEESGLIVPIGEWVIHAACAELRALREAGFGGTRIAVNLSPRQLHQRDVIHKVASALLANDVDARSLELEITESSLLQDPVEAERTLRALKDLGVRLALDDFGTGYSSFALLKQLPIDVLKIDRGFIRNLGVDLRDDAIVAAIIAMAKKLGIELVAEGVETIEQAQHLAQDGCEILQGYYFARPMPADALLEWLSARGGERATRG